MPRTPVTAQPLTGLAFAVAIMAGGCDRNDEPSGLTPPPPTASQPDTRSDAAEQPGLSEQRGLSVSPPPPPPADPLKLQDEAIEALESGDLDTAFKRIRAAIKITPDDPPTVFLMARILAERHRFPEAIWMLDEMAEKLPEVRLPVLGQTAEWLVLQGEWGEAEKRYRTLRSAVSDANARVVDRQLARLLNRQGRRSEAATHLRELCRFGDVEELELRSLLMTLHPLPSENADDPELQPIGPMGQARYEISQQNWAAAIGALNGSKTKLPAEEALRGRIYAHQQDFASLGKWADQAAESDSETADYWFAMGASKAHQGEHAAAVKCFCKAVLRDPTDAQAYRAMSQSLEQLEADSEAEKTAARAKLIQQTQRIGNEMAAGSANDVQKIAELVTLLDQLQRPFEALAWRAVQVYYGRLSSALSDQAARQAMSEINRLRLQQLQSSEPAASEEFILCGVDPEAL